MMPSAAAVKIDKQVVPENTVPDAGGVQTPLRQAITVIEHKIRNLEKRKSKLESYRELQNSGKDLNADQKNAVAKYDEVVHTLDFARDLSKQLLGIVVVTEKDAKKQAKRDASAKSQAELSKVREVLLVQDALNQMGIDSTRDAFLTGSKGAALITLTDLSVLDELYPLVTPKHEPGNPTAFTSQVQNAAEHLLAVVDSKPKDSPFGCTYSHIKEIIGKVHESGYLDNAEEEELVADYVDTTMESATAVTATIPEITANDDSNVASVVMITEEEPEINLQQPVALSECADTLSEKCPVAHVDVMQQQIIAQRPQLPVMDSTYHPQHQALAAVMDVSKDSHVVQHVGDIHHVAQHQSHSGTTLQPGALLAPVHQAAIMPMQQQMQAQVSDVTSLLQSSQAMLDPQPQRIYYQPPLQQQARSITDMIGTGSYFFLQESEIDGPAAQTNSCQQHQPLGLSIVCNQSQAVVNNMIEQQQVTGGNAISSQTYTNQTFVPQQNSPVSQTNAVQSAQPVSYIANNVLYQQQTQQNNENVSQLTSETGAGSIIESTVNHSVNMGGDAGDVIVDKHLQQQPRVDYPQLHVQHHNTQQHRNSGIRHHSPLQQQQQHNHHHQPFYANNNGYGNRNSRQGGTRGRHPQQ